MEDNLKYFQPEISDIRVGYEAEFDLAGFGKEGWQFVKFQGVDKAVRCYHEKGLYRVPYLTQEQIEAEGWRVSVGKDFRVTLFRKDNYTLGYNWEEKSIKIVTFGENSHTLYNGECKDINTFRYITKLLGI